MVRVDFAKAVKKEGVYGTTSALPELNVNMSNALAKSAHGLTLNEKRVIACCVAQLDSIRAARHPQYDQTKVILRATDFAETYDIDPKVAYRDILAASEKMFERYIRLLHKTPKGMKEIKFRWISGVTYHHGEGWIELGFSPEVTPHLTLLRREYTSYKLKTAAALRSTYSWRLYELFVSVWDKKKHPQMEGYLHIKLDDFRRAMDVPESYKWSNVSQKAIKPAVAELGELHNLKIEWTPRKKGRSVSSLSFFFEENSQAKLDI